MRFEGAVTFNPPLACEKAGRQIRCVILNPCVTEGSAIMLTLVIDVALGVPTKTKPRNQHPLAPS